MKTTAVARQHWLSSLTTTTKWLTSQKHSPSSSPSSTSQHPRRRGIHIPLNSIICISTLVILSHISLVTSQQFRNRADAAHGSFANRKADSRDNSIPPGASSLAFVFDITGSMYDDLVQVIEGAAKILATTLARREKPLYNYVLVPFHDPEIGPVTVTTDHYRFQQALRNLYVQGGGDCPEMCIGAIREALQESLPNSFVYVFTDARAKDYELTEEVLALIQSKQSQVTFVLTGDCGNKSHPGYESFEQIASISSGQVFSLKKNQVGEILEPLRKALLQTRKVNLMSVDRTHSDGELEVSLPVDSRLEEFTVQISGNKSKIHVYDPNGVKILKKNGLNVLLDLKRAYAINIKEPVAGIWKLIISAQGSHTIRVTGRSALDFIHGFSRHPTFEFEETDLRPIKGISSYLLLNATDLTFPGRFHKMELLNLRADTLMELPLVYDVSHPSLYNISSFVPPDDFFYIKVNGEDEQGFSFIRTTHTAITPEPPVAPIISMPTITHGYYDKTAVLVCSVLSVVPFTVQWYGNDGKRLGNRLYFSDSKDATWSIHDASSFSEGNYTCNASNAAGMSSFTTYLDVKDPPPQILKPMNVSVLPGRNALMTCVAYSTVDYNITWYRAGIQEDLDQHRRFTVFRNGSVLVKSVEKGDEAPYVCRAQNEGGYNEEKVWLIVQKAPIVTAIPTEANFVLRGGANVTCTAIAFPAPTFVWTKGGQVLPISNKFQYDAIGNIWFSDLRKEDAGEYECVATNNAGRGKALTTLYYMERPVIRTKEQTVLVNNGDTATLSCDAEGIPPPTVRWYKDDNEIDEFSYSYIEIDERGQLVIIGTQDMDAGNYKCIVTNGGGSDEGRINLQVGATPKILQGPRSQGAKILTNLTLPCKASGVPPPKITWSRADRRELNFWSGKFTIMENGALIITNMDKEDEGMYQCSVENRFGKDQVSAFITVTGVVPPLLAYGAPNVDTLPGRTVRMRCQVLLGNPWPTIRWFYRGELLRNSDRITVDESGNLEIRNVTLYDDGPYTCLASNVGGNQTLDTFIDVRIPPTIKNLNKDSYLVVKGQYMRLPCDAVGDPKPTVAWTKNGRRIEEPSPHYFIREDGSLEIFSATPDDTASYSCTAINVVGTAEKRMTLYVQLPPAITSTKDKYVVIVNNPVLMECDAEGIPPPTITWTKDGRILSRLNQNLIFLQNGALRIDAVQESDEGLYECIATSEAGNSTKVATLIVQVPPSISDPVARQIIVLVGEEALLPCEVSGDPFPEVSWSKDMDDIDLYEMDHVYMLQESGSLYIPQAKVPDTAKYLCVAENPAGFVTKELTLIVREIPSIPEGTPNATSVIENKPVNLPCPARGTPTPTITWFKDGVELRGDEPGIKLYSDGSMDIDRAQAEDAGRYVCEAVNVAGRGSHLIDLEVFYEDGNLIDGAPLERATKLEVIQNETFYLHCPVAAIPPPQITWFKDGEELRFSYLDARYTLSDNDKMLRVTLAQVTDTGRFMCIASNLAGETEKQTNVEVYVPPTIIDEQSSHTNLSSIIDTPAYIDCPATGVPRPVIKWFKDEKYINIDYEPNVRVLDGGQKLEISNTYIADDGLYRCLVENNAGKVERTYKLNVLVPARIENSDDISAPEVVVNNTITIHCPAFGIPPPGISWFIDGVSLSDYKPSPLKRMRKIKRLIDPDLPKTTTSVPKRPGKPYRPTRKPKMTTSRSRTHRPPVYPPGECVPMMPTYAGNADGVTCHFPFLYHSKEYSECYAFDGTPWCSVTYDFDNDSKWGYCDVKNGDMCRDEDDDDDEEDDEDNEIPTVWRFQSTTQWPRRKTSSIDPRKVIDSGCDKIIPTTGGKANGKPCVFPFLYVGQERFECQGQGKSVWCATTYNYDVDEIWGYCDYENAKDCVDEKTTRTKKPHHKTTRSQTPVTKKPKSSVKTPRRTTKVPLVTTKCTPTIPTYDGTAEGAPCVFPFSNFGVDYYECQGYKPWCATTYDYDNDDLWGYCDSENQSGCEEDDNKEKVKTTRRPKMKTTKTIKTTTGKVKATRTSRRTKKPKATADPNGCRIIIPTYDGNANKKPCIFPYLYFGVEQFECKGNDSEAWCATTYDYDNDDLWGYCDFKNKIDTCNDENNIDQGEITKREKPGRSTRKAKTTTPRIEDNGDDDDVCVPKMPTQDGKTCVFPFINDGVEYFECQGSGTSAWCSITDDYGDGEWGYCDFENEVICDEFEATTPTVFVTDSPDLDGQVCKYKILTVNDVECFFPFLYYGVEVNECQGIGTSAWCSTTYNYDEDGEYDYCDWQTETKCVEETKHKTTTTTTPRPTKIVQKPTKKPKKTTPKTRTTEAGKDNEGGCVPKILTVNGVECFFPFLYYGVEVNECQGIGTSAWCSTTYNYDEDGEYDYCDWQTETKCVEETKHKTTTTTTPRPTKIVQKPTKKPKKTTPKTRTTEAGKDNEGGCVPKILTVNGVECFFPFLYYGVEVNECQGIGTSAWCSTTYNYDEDGEYDYCDWQTEQICVGETKRKPTTTTTTQRPTKKTQKLTKRPKKTTPKTQTTEAGNDDEGGCVPKILTVNGVECFFPFLYYGVEVNECQGIGTSAWCSTTYNYDEDGEYDYCDWQTEKTCVEETKPEKNTITQRPPTITMKPTKRPQKTTPKTKSSKAEKDDGGCVPKILTVNGVECVFPFLYNGVEVNECQGVGTSAWCSTTYDYDTDGDYDYCDWETEHKCVGETKSRKDITTPRPTKKTLKPTKRPQKTTTKAGKDDERDCVPKMLTVNGVECFFPFLYEGVEVSECQGLGSYAWCSTTYNYGADGQYDYCDWETEKKCVGGTKPRKASTTQRPTKKLTKRPQKTTPKTTEAGNDDEGGCVPKMLTVNDEECIFPFLYYGVEVNECQGIGTSAWCSTTYNYDEDGEYDYCNFDSEEKCYNDVTNSKKTTKAKPTKRRPSHLTTKQPRTTVKSESCIPKILTVEGEECLFPFLYEGVEVNECQDPDDDAWCSTTYDYDNDGVWGYCDFKNEVKCDYHTDETAERVDITGRPTRIFTTIGFNDVSVRATTRPPVTRRTEEPRREVEGDDGCIPEIRTTDGQLCAFPFLYNGMEHYQCIGSDDNAWCSITYDFEKDRGRGRCDLRGDIKCKDKEGTRSKSNEIPRGSTTSYRYDHCVPKIPTEDGTMCVFPFTYGDIVRNECIKAGNKYWCSVSDDFEKEKAWSYCDLQNEIKCDDSIKKEVETTTTRPIITRRPRTRPTRRINPYPSVTSSTEDSNEREPCIPQIPTTTGKMCVFPFFYNNKEHYDCILSAGSISWCSITDNFPRDSAWAECDLKRAKTCDGRRPMHKMTTTATRPRYEDIYDYDKIEVDDKEQCIPKLPTVNGKTCHFPFTFKGVVYYECIQSATRSWCSASYDFDKDSDWGYCDFENEVKCDTHRNATTQMVVVTRAPRTRRPQRPERTRPRRPVSTLKPRRVEDPEKDGRDRCLLQIPTRGGKQCVFPFLLNRVEQFECVGTGANAWCSTDYDYDKYKVWGYCDFEKEVRCSEDNRGRGEITTTTTKRPRQTMWFRPRTTWFRPRPTMSSARPTRYIPQRETRRVKSTTERTVTRRNNVNDEVPCKPVLPTHSGNAKGAPCVFPFRYYDQYYYECIGPLSQAWCATTADFKRDRMFGICDFNNEIKCESDEGTVRTRPPRPITTRKTIDFDDYEGKCIIIPTVKGTANNKAPCVFPFLFKGIEHFECQGSGNNAWCAVSYDFDHDLKWGYCDVQNAYPCESETTDRHTQAPVWQRTRSRDSNCVPSVPTYNSDNERGEPCSFPFVYVGREYSECIKSDDSFWCGTTYNYDEEELWGYCDFDNAVTCEIDEDNIFIRTRPVLRPTRAPVTRKRGRPYATSKEPDCTPQMPTTGGKMCAFPYMNGGVEYHECQGEGSNAWCSLTSNFDSDGVWDYCDLDNEVKCNGGDDITMTKRPIVRTTSLFRGRMTSTTKSPLRTNSYKEDECKPKMNTIDGKKCVFPFLYGGYEYSECQGYGTSAWCSITYNYDEDEEYGYCDFDSEVGCDEDADEDDEEDEYYYEEDYETVPSTVREATTQVYIMTNRSTKKLRITTSYNDDEESDCVPMMPTTGGDECVFPYLDGGVKYYECQGVGTSAWCSTTYDYTNDGEWDYCDFANEVKCDESEEVEEDEYNYEDDYETTQQVTTPTPFVNRRTRPALQTTTARYNSKQESDCVPMMPTTGGDECVFPYLDGGVKYYECQGVGTSAWCSTTYDYTNDGEWDYCDLANEVKCDESEEVEEDEYNYDKDYETTQPKSTSRPKKTTMKSESDCTTKMFTLDGKKCNFPFLYYGVEVNQCQGEGTSAWCSTTYNYDDDGEYGYCDFDSEEICYDDVTNSKKTTKPTKITKKYKKKTKKHQTTTQQPPTAKSGGGSGECIPEMPTTGGEICVFPFIYYGVEVYQCEGSGDTAWCATTRDYDSDSLWDYCDLTKEVKCPDGDAWYRRRRRRRYRREINWEDYSYVYYDEELQAVPPEQAYEYEYIYEYVYEEPEHEGSGEQSQDWSKRVQVLDSGYKLNIRRAKVSDTRRYSCRAVNEAGHAEKFFDLKILVPAVIDRTGIDYNPKIVVNRTMLLNCPVDGIPEPSIRWYRNGTALHLLSHPNMQLISDGRQLKIDNIQVADAAYYKCEATNKAGKDTVMFDLQVQVPSEIDTTDLKLNPKVIVNKTLTLECPVFGIPAPRIEWYKNGEIIEFEIMQNVRVEGGGQKVVIYPAQTDDSGTYECKAINAAGFDRVNYNVEVYVPPYIDAEASTTSSPQVIENSTILLNCVVYGIPTPKVTWLVDKKPISSVLNRRLTMKTDNRQLELREAQVPDTSTYTCVAENAAGTARRDFDLFVLVPPYIDGGVFDENLSVIRSKQMILNCPAMGIPFPNVTWFKDDFPLIETRRYKFLLSGRQLEIHHSQEKDTGRFTCRANNIAGEAVKKFNLRVYVPPKIDQANVVDHPRVIVNRTVLLECPVSGIPPPKVSWLKNGKPLNLLPHQSLLENGKNLEIRDVQVTDTAKYTCIATNKAGQSQQNFDLEILSPPTIPMSSEVTYIEAIQNKTVYISCEADGIPPPTVMWLRDDVPLLDFSYENLRELNGGKQLEVRNVRVDDEGKYTCLANNPAGQQRKSFRLKVLIPPGINTRTEANIVTTVGRSVRIDCEGTGDPLPNITWYKDGQPLSTAGSGIRTLRDGRLLQISKVAVDNAGTFSCRAQNIAGQDQHDFTLEVQVPPKIANDHLVTDLSVVIGNSITMDCPATGTPKPKITWMRKGRRLEIYTDPNLKLLSDHKQLRVLNSQRNDEGSYSCVASNPAGNVTKQFMLKVLVPPSIDDGPRRIAAKVDASTVLHCEAYGKPAPKIIWEKDNILIPNSGLHYRVRKSGSLEFSAVKVEDTGAYRCLAKNEAGETEITVQLNVLVPPRISHDRPISKKVIVGQSVDLPCEASGVPRPTITWQKGNRQLSSQGGYELLRNGALRILDAENTDVGTYVCYATNDAGSDIGQVRLQVLVAPSIDRQKKAYTVIQEDKVTLPCRADGNPPPQITWEKDGKPVSENDFRYRVMRSGWLAIPIASVDDAGSYHCIAENEAGRDSIAMELTVWVPPSIKDTERIVTINEGERAVLLCEASGFPASKITWIQHGRTAISTGDRYTLNDDGSLVVDDVQSYESGSYVCTAVNKAGRDSKDVRLQVQVAPDFVRTPRDQEVPMNRRIELECEARGIPTPSLTWRVNNTNFAAPPSVNGFSRLVIDNAMKRDDGTYMCVAENAAGTRRALAAVRVKEPPIVMIPYGNQAFTLADKTFMHCPVEGDPPFVIIWTKDGRGVDVYNSDRFMQFGNGSLLIYDATESDAGDYECLVSNDAGTSTGIVALTLTYAPRFKVEPQDVTVELGDIVMMNCMAEGEPVPTISWRKGQLVLQDKDRITILANNSLRILAAQLEDSGIYICIATNTLGKVLKQADVTVQVHGHWSAWSDWLPCSHDCGDGIQNRSRVCDNPPPSNKGRPCRGRDTDEKSCRMKNCAIHGTWSSWGVWSDCSASCGKNVYRKRVRECEEPLFGGKNCDGDSTDRKHCYLEKCPENGGWSEWAEWSMCSVSCGGGQRTRRRECDSPTPSAGGMFCPGADRQIDYCNDEPCPIHGNWTQWTSWGDCTLSCGSGQQRRFRYCNNPPPKHNGRPCMGPASDTQKCNTQDCDVDPRWGEWSAWGECSRSCDGGRQSRERQCGGRRRRKQKACLGDRSQIHKCNLNPCNPRVLPKYAEGNIIGNINNNQFGVAKLTANISRTGRGARVEATVVNIPRNVGTDLRTLISLLSPVYWVTATEVGEAVNGFTLTEGLFRRETQVQFPTGEITKMTHVARGINSRGILELDIVIEGTVPQYPDRANIVIRPYNEDYIQTGAGSLYARSARVINVNGHSMPYFWNHTIAYDDERGPMPYLVERLTTEDPYVKFDLNTKVLQYVITASIAKGVPSNQCPEGFTLDQDGPYCIDADECCGKSPCSHLCFNTLGSYFCVCPDGMELDTTGNTCRDIDECEEAGGLMCSHYCSNSIGSYTCYCPVGMTTNGDMQTCQDIDECEHDQHNCNVDEDCVNVIGAYKCVSKCPPGFRRGPDNEGCEDMNECREEKNLCEQECHNTEGGYECGCSAGFRLVGIRRCIDINECRSRLTRCTGNCINTRGSFRCVCPTGFRLAADGECVDLDECARGSHRCRSDQECRNNDGGYACLNRCPTGFERANGSCVDVDECTSGRHRCHSNQACMNTVGAYTCICPRGFRSEGPGMPCQDIDECSLDPSLCSYMCENVEGTYNCICPPGQKLLADQKSCAGLSFLDNGEVLALDLNNNCDGKDNCYIKRHVDASSVQNCSEGYRFVIDKCIDIDECSSPVRCQHKCRNTEGSYQCSCPEGYRLADNQRTCEDIDECDELRISCGPSQLCFNRRGDYECIDAKCPDKYTRDLRTGYCVLPCSRSSQPCPPGARYADVLEFKLVALPNGIPAYQDLIRLIAYDQYRNHLRDTSFTILENDPSIPFGLRLETGKGVVYTLRPLEERRQYGIKVRAKSYDRGRRGIQYQTTFMIYISVSLYPY